MTPPLTRVVRWLPAVLLWAALVLFCATHATRHEAGWVYAVTVALTFAALLTSERTEGGR